MRDAVYHIIRESRQHAHWERTRFLPSLAPRGRGVLGPLPIVTIASLVSVPNPHLCALRLEFICSCIGGALVILDIPFECLF